MKRLLIGIFLTTFIFLGLQTEIVAQENTICESEFLIVVGTVNGEFRMTCLKGCAWKSTSFRKRSNSPQAIWQYGMTTLPQDEDQQDPNLANFLFTIQRQGDDLELIGMKGTAWKKLRFDCQDKMCTQGINQNGMIVE